VESNTATAEQPEYLTVAEVSSRFRVSVPTIYRRCADGTLPHIRIGGDGPIRIPASQLERLYDQGVPDDGSPAGAASPAQTPLSAVGSLRALGAACPPRSWDADMRSLRSPAGGSQPPGR
jgi:excisionase family DNA binding protein